MKKDYIFFGVQGSGKGTQGKILAEKEGLNYFDTGSQLRKMAQEDTDLGREIKSCVDAGTLAPDELIMKMVREFIISAISGVIFDGLPRNEEQRKMFEDIMEELDRKPTGILIKISKEEAVRRAMNRWMSKSTGKIYMSKEAALADGCEEEDLYQRDDDKNQATVEGRIGTYYEQTEPVIDWYREQDRLIEVDGMPPIEEVTKLVDQAIS
jgi:adenylate kinase